MTKTISLSGMGVITSDCTGKNLMFFEFHPDEQGVEITTPCLQNGKLQLMRDGTVFFTAERDLQTGVTNNQNDGSYGE